MSVLSLFESSSLLVAAVAAAVVAGVLVVAAVRRRRERLLRLAEQHLLARLSPVVSRAAAPRAVRLGLAALCAGLAFAGPRWGEEATRVRGQGVDVVLALDASLSMMATDDRPNRLERLKQEVRRYRSLSRGDRVALLAFAGRSYILTPLTVDDGALELFLENLDPSIVGQAGSSLARTITQATELLLATKSASDRAIVIMSDGEAFEPVEEITQAAQRAANEGIALVAVGFGTAEGATIPVTAGGEVTLKRDENNQVVVSRYNPATLQAIAEAAQGTFIDASATDKAARIRGALQRLRASERTVAGGVTRTPRFQWFLLPALLLLLVDTWLEMRRRRPALRGAAAAATMAVTVSCAWPGGVASEAAQEFNAGRYARSAALYRSAIREGDARPEMLYNFGTALVAGDSLAAAAEPLERSSKSDNAEIRFRALFNLGLSHLKRGLAAEAQGDSSARPAFTAAVAVYKSALLLRATDQDAKWNYELALRKEQENGGGGGGGDSDANQQNQSEFDTPESSQPSGGLGQQQAEQLLNAAAREERGVQGRKQKNSRAQPPPGGKDW